VETLNPDDIVITNFDAEVNGVVLKDFGVRVAHRPTGVKAEGCKGATRAHNEAHALNALQQRVAAYLSKSTPEARFHGMIKKVFSTRQQAIIMAAFRAAVTPDAMREKDLTK
jgi:protein subunit release factor A